MKRKPSERTLFERWYSREFGLTLADMRGWRTEAGYGWQDIDSAWMGWNARSQVIQ